MTKNLPALANQQERVAAALRYHHAAQASAAQMAIAAAKCGLELKAIKKECGHGPWVDFFENHFQEHGLSLRTAQKYMALADGLKGKALKNESGAFLALLDSPPSKLTEAESKKLTKDLGKVTDGATLSELYQDFGLVKRPQGAGAKGGKKAKANQGDDGEVTPELIAAGKVATTEALVTALEEALADKPWNAADEKLRKKLHGLLEDVRSSVKEAL